jgi:hypothetical protein
MSELRECILKVLKESPIDYIGTVSEDINGNIDTLTMDIPLFLRLLEYAKEDAKTDLDLHYVTENALKCMQGKNKLSMDCYKNIIPSEEQKSQQEPEEKVDEDEQI